MTAFRRPGGRRHLERQPPPVADDQRIVARSDKVTSITLTGSDPEGTDHVEIGGPTTARRRHGAELTYTPERREAGQPRGDRPPAPPTTARSAPVGANRARGRRPARTGTECRSRAGRPATTPMRTRPAPRRPRHRAATARSTWVRRSFATSRTRLRYRPFTYRAPTTWPSPTRHGRAHVWRPQARPTTTAPKRTRRWRSRRRACSPTTPMPTTTRSPPSSTSGRATGRRAPSGRLVVYTPAQDYSAGRAPTTLRRRTRLRPRQRRDRRRRSALIATVLVAPATCPLSGRTPTRVVAHLRAEDGTPLPVDRSTSRPTPGTRAGRSPMTTAWLVRSPFCS